MDGVFWTPELDVPVFDEHGFFDYSSRMGENCVLGVDEAEQHSDAPISFSESSINMSEAIPLEDPNGFLSVPMFPNERIDQAELISCEDRLIDVQVSDSRSYIDVSKFVPMENSNGSLSMPTTSTQHMYHNSNMPMDHTHSTGNDETTFMDKTSDKKHGSSGFEEGTDNAAPKVRSYNKGGFKGVSWGSYREVMDALLLPISSYSLLYEHSMFQTQQTPRKKEVLKPNNNAVMIATNKNMMVKKYLGKEPLDSFPSNVKSLIGTGMFDEVLVRYVSPSGELPGIISVQGYLCGCESCNFSKPLNAYEFESHAGYKTSHPNSHIRFENEKSMHQVVQELKVTPRSMLFDAIQTVTGSPINQKAFIAWKESFKGNQYVEIGNGGMIQM